MLYTFQLLLTSCIVFAALYFGVTFFIKFLDSKRFIFAVITLAVTVGFTGFTLKSMEQWVNEKIELILCHMQKTARHN